MPDSDLGAVLGPGVRDVGGVVVGHDSFNGDAVGGEPGDGPIEERDAGGCFLVGQDLDVGDAVGVIDTDVHGFPADAMVVVAWFSAGDVVAGFVETAELFDVDVDQLAWMAAAISIRWLWRFEFGEPVQTDPFQHCGHRRQRHVEFLGDLGAGYAQLAQLLDERFGLGRCVRRRRARPRMTDPSSAHPRRNEPTTSGRCAHCTQQHQPRQRPFSRARELEHTSTRAETDKDGRYREDPRVSLRCE